MQTNRCITPARLSLLIAGVLGVQLPSLQAGALTFNIDTKSGYSIGPGGSTASSEDSQTDSTNSSVYIKYGDYGTDPHTYGTAKGDNSGWMYTYAFGQGSTYAHTSEVVQNVEFTNDSGSAQDYLYNFLITWGSLTAYNYNFTTQDEYSRAGYLVDIMLNGNSVWSSAFELLTDINGTTTAGSGPMLGSYSSGSSYYSWSPYSGQINLGVLAAGASFELSYKIRTYVDGNHLTTCYGYGNEPTGEQIGLMATEEPACDSGYGYGGYGYGGYLDYAGYTYAQFGDPFNFDGNAAGFTQNNLVGRTPGSVSEPGSLAILGAGVAALAFRRRQKKVVH